jgi:hypothetical protein
MVNQHPFLLETIVWVNNNTSKQHLIFYRPQHEHVSLLLNNSLDNKWFISKIPFWSIYTIIPFLTCSLTKYLKPIMLEFIMFRPWGGCLAYSSTNLPNLLIIFPNFLHNTSNVVWTTTSFNCGLPLMCVHTFHWPCMHLFLMLHPSQWAHMDQRCSL